MDPTQKSIFVFYDFIFCLFFRWWKIKICMLISCPGCQLHIRVSMFFCCPNTRASKSSRKNFWKRLNTPMDSVWARRHRQWPMLTFILMQNTESKWNNYNWRKWKKKLNFVIKNYIYCAFFRNKKIRSIIGNTKQSGMVFILSLHIWITQAKTKYLTGFDQKCGLIFTIIKYHYFLSRIWSKE